MITFLEKKWMSMIKPSEAEQPKELECKLKEIEQQILIKRLLSKLKEVENKQKNGNK